MKRFAIVLIISIQQLVSIAQTDNLPTDTTRHTVVDQAPTFPGGEKKMTKFFKKNLKYPPAAYKEGRAGLCIISFVVEKDGSLTFIKILRGASGGADLDDEALRVIKSMPKWNPGKQKGNTVRVDYNLPIRFLR